MNDKKAQMRSILSFKKAREALTADTEAEIELDDLTKSQLNLDSNIERDQFEDYIAGKTS